MTGPLAPDSAPMRDLGLREVGALAPLVLLIVGLGFFPKPLIDVIEPSVEDTLERVEATDPEPAVSPDEVPAAEEAHE